MHACLERAAALVAAEVTEYASVPRLHYVSLHRADLSSLAACRVPFVATNSVVSSWPALSSWQAQSYLTDKVPVLQEAYIVEPGEAAQRAAVLESEALEAGSSDEVFLAPDPSGELQHAPVPTAAFFREGDEASAEPALVMYYARWMGFGPLAPLRADASPHEALHILDAEDVHKSDEAEGLRDDEAPLVKGLDGGHDERRYFRLGSNGSASTLHHDEYHNAYAQVVGSKRWFLLPPTGWPSAWSFPRGHPRARQSPRAPLYEWSRQERRAAGVVEVVTNPADVLYLPPYFWHQTLTTDRSVAVNVWSRSRESESVASALVLLNTSAIFGQWVLNPDVAEAMGTQQPARGDLTPRQVQSQAAPRYRHVPPPPHDGGPSGGGVQATGTGTGTGLQVGTPGVQGTDTPKELATCAAAGTAHVLASALAPGLPLLSSLYEAQYSHLHTRRSSVRRRTDWQASHSAPPPTAATSASCPRSCRPLDGAEASRASAVASILTKLPDGIRELALADALAELADVVASAVPPVANSERARTAVVRCMVWHAGRRDGQ